MNPPADPRWRRAEPGRADWIMRAEGGYCRVYELTDGRWYWTAARAASLGSGVVATRDEAMAEAKAAWEGRDA